MSTSFADAATLPRPVDSTTRAPEPGRLDLYAGIHKALRHFMSDTLMKIGRLDVADVAERTEALDQLNALLDFCLGHLRHENEHVHTAIEARQPAGSSRIAGEHVEHVDAIAELRDEAKALRSACDACRADADRLALRLYRHLALFVADNFQHMHIEETSHNALLWQHYSDAELAALHGRILASIAPEEHLVVARWMVPASTPSERAAIVGGMKAQMPPEALLGVLTMLRPHVDDAGWAKLAAAVGVDPRLGRA